MAAAEKDDGVPHPRETLSLYGHAEAELAFLEAYRGTRMPHAWLIGGPRGIGKATLAYRMARFVFAHPDQAGAAVRAAETLALPPDNSAVRRVAAQGHSDLLVLERTEDDKGKMPTVISVDLVRKTIGFFGITQIEFDLNSFLRLTTNRCRTTVNGARRLVSTITVGGVVHAASAVRVSRASNYR